MLKHIFCGHLAVLLVFTICCSNAIKLNPNGGYDIVIGVEDNVPEPLSVAGFLDQIRIGVDTFSAELWKSTKRRFFINSVDVVVPSNWWTLSTFNISTWQTVEEAEIRISHDAASPNVVNPNPCGVSGHHIYLPDHFFRIGRGGQFGSVGRALLNMWARYRYGVWEEHGIPGNTKFPYFYSAPSFTPKWEATGCSNEPLVGSYRTVEGDVDARCHSPSNSGPADDCRFIPSPANTANSSLTYIQFLDSVSQFCDSKTHNYVAPNRHNLLCGHRSVWDVIKESDDYTSTVTCTESMAFPKFRVMKESRMPELYILLDRGRTITPVKVMQEIMGVIMNTVSLPQLDRINVAVGTYPHNNVGRDHTYVKTEIGWSPISSVIYDIQRVLDESTSQRGPVIRDFGLAIQEVAEKIKQRNHRAGTVLFVVKRGAGANTFDQLTHEEEVIASIKEDNRIKVYAIETQQGTLTPYSNLQSVVEHTFGRYHFINGTVNIVKQLEGFFFGMQEVLEQPSIMNSITSWVIQKQVTQSGTDIEIPVYDNTALVRIHLITDKHMLASHIKLVDPTNEQLVPATFEKAEWNENYDFSKRLVFTYLLQNPKQGSVWNLQHECPSGTPKCEYFLIATAEKDSPSPRSKDILVPQEDLFNSQSITIDISTSAEHNHLDMSHQRVKIVPFAIYAKIEMNQQRVLGLTNVTAFIRFKSNHGRPENWLITLEDNGNGLPDVSDHDGIYSGVFTPSEDGLYQISVSAFGKSGDGNFQDIRSVNIAGGLMPKDQVNFGCTNSTKARCLSAVPTGSFSRVQDMIGTVAVENAATFKPGKPMKILDFAVETFPNYNVEFTFTSPKLLGSDDKPDEYRIYMAPHIDNFLGSTDMTKLIVQQVGQPSGEQVKIPFNAGQKAIPYYAVEAVYKGQKGGPSNVVGVAISEIGTTVFPSTTTEGPTTTESPTSTTTEFSYPTTDEPPSTTPESSEESEEDDTDEPTEYPTSSTTEWPSTSTTENPTSTTEGDPITSSTPEPSSSTTLPPTSDITGITGSSTTEAQSTTTEDGVTFSTSSTTTEPPSSTMDTTFTTTEEPTESTSESESSSTTTPLPTSDFTGITSSTTEFPSTTEDITGPTSETPPSSTTTPSPSSDLTSSTTEIPTTTEEVTGPTSESPSSSTTTPPPTSDFTDITSSTTDVPTSTTEDITGSTSESSSSSTTTPSPTSDSTDFTSSSTTEVPSTTTDISSTTEEGTGPTSESPSSSTTTPSPTSDFTDITSSTTEIPSSTPEDITRSTSESPSSSTTTPSPTSDLTDFTSSSTTEIPSTTMDITSTTEDITGPTSETSSSSTTTPSPTSDFTSSTTEISSTTEKVTGPTSESPSSSTTTPSPTSDFTDFTSSSTTEVPSSTTDITSTTEDITGPTTEFSSSSTTTAPPPTDITETTTTEIPSSTTDITSTTEDITGPTSESPSSSTTTSAPSSDLTDGPTSTTENPSTTSETPSTTENDGPSSTTETGTTESSSSTTSEAPTEQSSSTTELSSTTPDEDPTSESSETPTMTTDGTSKTTGTPITSIETSSSSPSSTTDSLTSHQTSPITETTSPELPSTISDTPTTGQSTSSSFKIVSSESLLGFIAISIIYMQRLHLNVI